MEKHVNKMGSVKFVAHKNSMIIWLKSLRSKNSIDAFSVCLKVCENATQWHWIFFSQFSGIPGRS